MGKRGRKKGITPKRKEKEGRKRRINFEKAGAQVELNFRFNSLRACVHANMQTRCMHKDVQT